MSWAVALKLAGRLLGAIFAVIVLKDGEEREGRKGEVVGFAVCGRAKVVRNDGLADGSADQIR